MVLLVVLHQVADETVDRNKVLKILLKTLLDKALNVLHSMAHNDHNVHNQEVLQDHLHDNNLNNSKKDQIPVPNKVHHVHRSKVQFVLHNKVLVVLHHVLILIIHLLVLVLVSAHLDLVHERVQLEKVHITVHQEVKVVIVQLNQRVNQLLKEVIIRQVVVVHIIHQVEVHLDLQQVITVHHVLQVNNKVSQVQDQFLLQFILVHNIKVDLNNNNNNNHLTN